MENTEKIVETWVVTGVQKGQREMFAFQDKESGNNDKEQRGGNMFVTQEKSFEQNWQIIKV